MKRFIINAIVLTAFLSLLTLMIIGLHKEETRIYNETYFAVYLENGEAYFGNYSNGKMTNAWVFSKNENGEMNALSIKDLLVKPKGDIKFNKDKINMVLELSNESPIVKTIKEENTKKPA